MTIGTRERQLFTQSASLNNTRRTVTSNNMDAGGKTIQSATIAAVAETNSFDDSAGELPVFKVGQLVNVSGFEKNSRVWRVVTSDADSLVVDGGTVQDESEGATVTIKTT